MSLPAPRKRSFLFKAAVAILAVLVLVAAAVAVLVPRLLDPERLRALVEQEGSAALGRPVTVKAVSAGLFSGVGIEALRIGGRGGAGDPLLEAGRAVARFRLLPLLWLEVVVDRVEINAPRIRVARDAKGRWDFADLLATPPPAGAAPERKAAGLPLRVAVALVRVTDASVSVRDDAVRPARVLGVDQVNLDLQRFSLEGAPARIKLAFAARVGERSFPVTVAGGIALHLARAHLELKDLVITLPGLTVATNGEVGEFRSKPRLDLRERVTLDLRAAGASVRSLGLAAGLPEASGAVSLDATVTGTPDAPRFKGDLVLKGVTASLQGQPHALEGLEGAVAFDETSVTAKELKGTALGVPFTAGLAVAGLKLSGPGTFTPNGLAPSFHIALPGVTAEGTASFAGWPGAPRYGFAVKGSLDLEKGMKLAAGLGALPSALPVAPAGSIGLDAMGSYAAGRIAFKASAALNNVSARHKTLGPVLEGANGAVEITEDRLTVSSLKASIGGQPFTLTADVARLGLAEPAKFSAVKLAPKGKAAVAFALLDTDKLLTALGSPPVPPPKPGTPPPPPLPEPDLRGVVPDGAELDVEVLADELRYGRLVLSSQRIGAKVTSTLVRWSEEGRLYGGTQAGSGTVQIGVFPIRHAESVTASGVDAGPCVDAAVETFQSGLSAKGKLSGTASVNVKAASEGLRGPAIKKTLAANGSFAVTNGKVTGAEFLKGGVGKALKLDWLGRGIAFVRMGGNFTVAKGVATLPDFVLDPGADGDLGITYKGTVTLEEEKFDGAMTTRFHPRHADEVSAGEIGKTLFSKDESGWAVGEWDVAGTLPVVTPSKRRLAKRAVEVAKEKLGPDLEKAAKEGLKKLFGR